LARRAAFGVPSFSPLPNRPRPRESVAVERVHFDLKVLPQQLTHEHGFARLHADFEVGRRYEAPVMIVRA
jgi:hypothetical protein